MPQGPARSRMCLKFFQSLSLGPGPGSRCPLTLGPPLPRAAVCVPSLLVGDPLCGRLHGQPHNSQSPSGHAWIVAAFSTFLCRWHCKGWRLGAGAADSEITRGNSKGKKKKEPSLRDTTGNQHKLTAFGFVPLRWLLGASLRPAARVLFSSFHLSPPPAGVSLYSLSSHPRYRRTSFHLENS